MLTVSGPVTAALSMLLMSSPLQSATDQQSAKPQAGAPLAREANEIKLPEGQVSLGAVRLTSTVSADGQRLEPGTYRLRLTGEVAKPAVVGQSERLERWVEFLQGSAVKARAVASVVPGASIGEVASVKPPAPGRHRVERLKEDDYLRIWINKDGDHVLLHLPLLKGS